METADTLLGLGLKSGACCQGCLVEVLRMLLVIGVEDVV